jgi:predicted nucleic acid-binding protein
MVGKKQKTIYQVKIIVDANIVFSAILNSDGKIGDLLINSQRNLEFIAPDFLRVEIRKHHQRLSKISGMSLGNVRESEFQVCKDITFISEEQIPPSIWVLAEKLVADIDPKDTHYIAFSKYFKCKIWSYDKVLKAGLEKKGFKNFISTNELYLLREKKS